MNMAANPTRPQLDGLIATADDEAAHHMLWLDFQGGVHLTALPNDLTPAGFAKTNSNVVKFRLETFNRGNGYVGLEAVKDKRWMERLFIALDQAWKMDETGYCDEF
jgi:hypothetical protein